MRDDDPFDRPRPPVRHEIGTDLSAISAGELRERIALLKDEIARVEAEIGRKDASRQAAASFFRSET